MSGIIKPPIPTRFHITGDIERGKTFMSFGNKQLSKLVDSMQYNNIQHNKINPVTIGGATVSASMNYGVSDVYIHFPLYEEEEDEVEFPEECLCFPCFSSAIVDRVYINNRLIAYTGEFDPEIILIAPTEEELRLYPFTYDVIACNGEELIYLVGFKIRAMGWDECQVGQEVLLTINKNVGWNYSGIWDPDRDDRPNCCINDLCLVADSKNTDKTGTTTGYTYMMIAPVTVPVEE